jgi:uncharacterized membrane protein
MLVTPPAPVTASAPPHRSPVAPAAWSVTGVLLACIGYLVALTPSLVPRTTPVQVLMSVLLTATGYAVGAILGAFARLGWRWSGRAPWVAPERARRWVWLPVLLTLAFTPWALAWQAELSAVIGWPLPSWPRVVLIVPPVVLALVGLARLVRAGARRLAGVLGRVLPGPVLATVAAGVLVGALVVAALLTPLVLVHRNFVGNDTETVGQTPPASPLRSGGPGSLARWEDLGRQGREFVTNGPSAAQISAFTGRPALEPIRLYAGMAQATTPQARAALAVEELRRSGAYERDVVVLVTTSGLGAVHPVAASSLEYVTEGDVALVASQFSAVPSWMTNIVDPEGAAREAAALLDAVEADLATVPAAQRPRLVVYGESLGAFGSQQALVGTTPEELAERFDGVLWVGSPWSSALLEEWVHPERFAWTPVVGDGSVVRVAAGLGEIPADDPTWGPSRVLFLQARNDPVALVTGSVLTGRPPWLDTAVVEPPRGMVWWPIFTWQQLMVDLTTNGFVPPGFGHNYSHAHAAAWVAVLGADGWDEARLDALREHRRSLGDIDPGAGG